MEETGSNWFQDQLGIPRTNEDAEEKDRKQNEMKVLNIRTGDFGTELFAVQCGDRGEYALREDFRLLLFANFREARSYADKLDGRWDVRGCLVATPQE